MPDGDPRTARARRPKESFAEGRERRRAVDDPDVVLEAAGRFLETRARSVAEVRRRLTSAGYRLDLVEGAISRLSELGMLDDASFARAWVESRDRARPRGERALRQELNLKGIDRTVLEEVLADRRAPTGGDKADVDAVGAERLLARTARSLERVADPRQRRQRAYALLARNGFDPAICASASAAFVRGDEGDDEATAPD
jgi:regulatory protein